MTNDGSVITSVFDVLLILVNAVFFSKDELHLPVEVTHGYVGKLLIRRDHRWISATVVRCHPHKVSKSSFFFFEKLYFFFQPLPEFPLPSMGGGGGGGGGGVFWTTHSMPWFPDSNRKWDSGFL